MDCVFCQILAGTLPVSRVADEELVMAFLDINPVNAGHALVIPRRHAVSLSDLRAEEMRALGHLAQRVAAAQRDALACEGVNLFLADGAVAGQEVFHVHLHVFPRHKDDGFGLRLPAGYGTVERGLLDITARQLRDAFE